jgi:hypothetical protein
MTQPHAFGECRSAHATRTGRLPRPRLLDLFSCAYLAATETLGAVA